MKNCNVAGNCKSLMPNRGVPKHFLKPMCCEGGEIEMLRAHMPNTFKTPGTGQINVETGDKILVMDEATRAKLIDRRREKLLAFRCRTMKCPTLDKVASR